MLAIACARSPLGRHRPGGLPVGLTRRAKLFTTLLRSAVVPHLCAASAPGGFLADICESNDRIRQHLSALSSTDFQANLIWTEVAVTRSAAPDLVSAPGTQVFKDSLRDVAISMSSAHGKDHIVFVKWRSEVAAADGVARTTLYNVGFNPPELAVEFLRRAKLAEDTAVGGFRILGHSVSAVEHTEGKGFRFYVPIPPGWTDEELCLAMIMQGGLDFDHLLTFGVDMPRNLNVSAPSGDMYFNFAPVGCIDHGSEDLVPITQPPSRMFVCHPVTQVENHLRIRKAGACNDCWKAGLTRHRGCKYEGVCKMCLVPYAEMPEGGKRHACGQGHLSKPPSAAPRQLNPGDVPAEAPPSSPLAAKLREAMLRNIEEARAKRKRETPDAPAAAEGVKPSETPVAETPANKATKVSGGDSPGTASGKPGKRSGKGKI